jgi:hypothetical protein
MASEYVPKVGDVVFRNRPGFVRYVVKRVDKNNKTAGIVATAGPQVLTDVPWSELNDLDESQNALRIVREATGDR